MGSGSTSELAVHQPRRIGDADVMGRRSPELGLVITDSIDDTATPDVPDHRSRIGKPHPGAFCRAAHAQA